MDRIEGNERKESCRKLRDRELSGFLAAIRGERRRLMEIQAGRLYIIATPIGKLGDITARARICLAGVDTVACEDTRHSGVLLQHLGIRKPLVSVHEHNEASRSAQLVAEL